MIFAASAAATVSGLVFYVENRRVAGTGQFFDPVMPAVAVAFPALGAFIVSRRPANVVGWLWLATAGVAVAFLAEQYAVHALIADPGSLPGGTWAAWVAAFVWLPGYLALWTLVPLVFPDGRLPSPAWRPVLWVAAALIATATLGAALTTENAASPSTRNPLAIESLPDLGGPAQALAVLVLGPVCVAALVVRYRRSPSSRRGQLRPVVLATAVALLVPVSVALASLLGVVVPLGAYRAAGLAGLLAIPVAAAAAVVRSGLYGIDLEVDSVVNVALVYGALATVATAAYVAIVTLIETVGSGTAGLGPSLAAVAAVAVLTHLLRSPFQRRVDRLLYRKRRYDYRVLTSLGQSVQSSIGPDAVLPAIVATISAGLRVPYVGIVVGQGDEVVASAAYGQAGEDDVVVPLVHHSEAVGRLRVAPRAPHEPFDAADRRLLDDLARQVSVAAYALCLTADLQRSRERLVTAREEERRRLRRDLHDGLKPALAGVSLGLEAVSNSLGADNPANQLLARLKAELDAAAADIRRLVYDLRPSALDELGLVGALRQHAARFGLDPDGLQVVVDAPPEIAGLPAAVEVAAYRIGVEALENVRRHARARHCEVVVSVRGGHLELEIRDDGEGLDPGRRPGVGLVAMRERAAELGGTCQVEHRASSGTCVRATLPIDGR
ncbi:MAG TPA: histidine kinase [Acidimicrobiales bacterium]|nr:histidine kinase [Acidimicrobiales bacterium]